MKSVSRCQMKKCLERKRKKAKALASKLTGKDLIVYQTTHDHSMEHFPS